MTMAYKQGDTVRITDNIIDGLAGFKGGYSVKLHNQPGIKYQVQAANMDQACKLALKCAQAEGFCRVLTGTTSQARE